MRKSLRGAKTKTNPKKQLCSIAVNGILYHTSPPELGRVVDSMSSQRGYFTICFLFQNVYVLLIKRIQS